MIENRSIDGRVRGLIESELLIYNLFFQQEIEAQRLIDLISKQVGSDVLIKFVDPARADQINFRMQCSQRAPEAAPDGFMYAISFDQELGLYDFTLLGVIEVALRRGLKINNKLTKHERYFSALRDSGSIRHQVLKSALMEHSGFSDYSDLPETRLVIPEKPFVVFLGSRPYSRTHSNFVTQPWHDRFSVFIAGVHRSPNHSHFIDQNRQVLDNTI